MSTEKFINRHLGVNDSDLPLMLSRIGVGSLEELIDQTIPEHIRLSHTMDLPQPMSEHEYLQHIEALSSENIVSKTYIGLGYNQAILPSVIKRNIFENPSWYTPYTPYQAEVAQGRLEALLNFQTVVSELTQMEIANASLLDEATAAAEAMSMLFDLRTREQKKNNVLKFFVSEKVFPQTLSVLKSRSVPLGIELVVGDHQTFVPTDAFFGALVQYPDVSGEIFDYESWTEQLHQKDIKVVVASDLMSLVLLKAPGQWNADVVVGTTQRFGIPLGFGGPHAAYFATREQYKRSLPGRIIGVTRDMSGGRALRMALQTREQHIKRDKATSNICTAQALLATMAGMYAVYHGADGLRAIARQIHLNTVSLKNALSQLGYKVITQQYFDTLVVEADASKVKSIAQQNNINFYYPSTDKVSISIHEATTAKCIAEIVEVFALAKGVSSYKVHFETEIQIPDSLLRHTDFLQEDVFCLYRSETEMMRYIKSLERKDLALNHSMISLGSCTMKLNPATAMLPLSQSAWADIHPFAPEHQVKGYKKMLTALQSYLSEITGFAATSLQPNSGAQGEYAGLMVIRAYHEKMGQSHRNICLIPASAHGTNPASAVMAGMKVVVVATDDKGNIDTDDLKKKALQHKDNLAALMVTYPSTHGVFESSIKDITHFIHSCGGQVYMDGANMNAQVGLTNPATIGADVCHLNLHKTFAIPHGGGGPGVGPICVAEHLKAFLPTHSMENVGGSDGIDAVSAAPYGSAYVCLISYAYIRMLGAEGLKKATQNAILNANYLKESLKNYFPILYTGEKGRAAHEIILDCRSFKEKGIEVGDIAKRLMDYGFHAPTVSFPVAGTLMVEPTESESMSQLDKFIKAMISIREEIDEVDPLFPDNVLKNAPHTLQMLTDDEWDLPYTRQKAAYPLPYLRENKFWASVRRVDDAYGDRNLVCSCAPIEIYIEN